ncbi:hypothetical protein GQ602_002845 [Ophiocordyceps camponoti-floridani]|uniref:Enoyl reductase (ER) domain-containing protein n=1 Tax=Ophiocordyceps camponoti-floridani TaxID=2030778 RepID=A0A8H4QB67_9HYPO|nr:hypothetical protein GQ602_002845 [Ophiocordyceps camponoti-floridani]
MSRVLTLKKLEGGRPGRVYYPLQLQHEQVNRTPGPGEVLVQLRAVALNHRDLFLRRLLYPGLAFDRAICCDGSGVVRAVGSNMSSFRKGDDVLLAPVRGWESDPIGPELDGGNHCVGGVRDSDFGTARDYMLVKAEDLVLSPRHLSAVEAAALPLAGLTAWRAVVTKARCEKGMNVLITGIGGGVALSALQFVVAMGATAFITSSSEDKMEKARKLGAQAGVNYRDSDWGKKLSALLPASRPYLDVIIDGAGGDIVDRAVELLRPGGAVVQYGMTVGPSLTWTMRAVMANIDIRGSTLGSRREFVDMVAFVEEHGIRPVVSRCVRGLDDVEGIERLFSDMDRGSQFGKLVIEIDGADEGSPKL